MKDEIEKNLITLSNQDWYDSLVNDLKSTITEGIFSSKEVVIHTWYSVGKRILEENHNFERSKVYGQKILKTIAESINVSERSLNYAIKFAKENPDIEKFMEDKDKSISWSKICKKINPPKEKEKECEHDWQWVERCSKCGKIKQQQNE